MDLAAVGDRVAAGDVRPLRACIAHDHAHLARPDLIYVGINKELGWEQYALPKLPCYRIPPTTVEQTTTTVEAAISLQTLAEKADAVCFGTLGQRSAVSRDTVRQFINSTSDGCLRILDINLRPPYWTKEVILESLPLANVLKLNSDELPIVASLHSLQGSEEELMLQLLRKYSFRLAALTRGAMGSLLLSETGERSELPGQKIEVVDTVGAGDAFTAALTVGLLKNKPLAEVHSWADRIAAFVCTQAGATPEFPDEFRC